MSVMSPEGFANLLDDLEKSFDAKMGKVLLRAATYCAGELDRSTKKNLNKRSDRKRPHKKDPTKMVFERSRSGVSGSSGLAGSWAATFWGRSEGGLSAGAYSHLPYAKIHDEGDTITPKRAKALAFPLTTDAEDYRPREFPGKLFFLKTSKKPNIVGVLAEVTGKPSDPVKAQYALAKWVKIPATHYIKEAREKAAPKVGELIGEDVLQIFMDVRGEDS